MAGQGNWEAALYIDQRATPQQAAALATVFSGQAGGHLGNGAPLITRVLEMEVEPVKGGDPQQDPYLVNAPLCISPQFPNDVAVSRRGTYSDHGRQWDNTGKNGFFASFSSSASGPSGSCTRGRGCPVFVPLPWRPKVLIAGALLLFAGLAWGDLLRRSGGMGLSGVTGPALDLLRSCSRGPCSWGCGAQ